MASSQAGDSNGGGMEQFGTPNTVATDGPPLEEMEAELNHAANRIPGMVDEVDDDEEDDEERSFFVRALYDFESTEASSLSFAKGTLIEVLTQLESGWWDGLLGNEVRGWFPSNYVERISDEEAEVELQRQQQEAMVQDLGQSSSATTAPGMPKSVGSGYSGLGLGQDFENLRQLMNGVSPHDEEADTFEQLAEASMQRQAADAVVLDGREGRRGVIDARRRSRISDQSSPMGSLLTNTSVAHSNVSQTDISSAPPRSAAVSISDADSVRQGGNVTAAAHKPGSSSRLDRHDAAQDKERLRSHTISVAENQPQGTRSQSTINRPRAQTTYTDSLPSRSAQPAPSGRTSPRDKTSNSSDSESFWVPKINEQGDIVYLNTQTGRSSKDPADSEGTLLSNGLASNANRHATDSRSHVVAPLNIESPRRPPRSVERNSLEMQPSRLSNEIVQMRRSTSAVIGPQRRAEEHLALRRMDESRIQALQRQMSLEGTMTELSGLIEEAGDAIAVLAAMAAEPIGQDGMSEEDVKALPSRDTSLQDASRLSLAMTTVVAKVRDLLRAAGALGYSPIDMLHASEQHALLIEADGPTVEVLQIFEHVITSLQGRALHAIDLNEADPSITAALLSALGTPPATSIPLGKKINATLSKLVLSSRSVIEQSCLNATVRPSFTKAQIDKIVSYRQRIKDDSMDLARAIGVFGSETQPVHRKASVASGLSGRPVASWTRPRQAYLQSGEGISGIGMDSFGGGSAAGWRGHGFVLPTARQAAFLRAKARSTDASLQYLTREAHEQLASGSIALRRKPTLPLTRSLFEDALAPRFAEYRAALSQLSQQLSEAHSTMNGEEMAMRLADGTEGVLQRFGALLGWIEEIDLASVLDVDGPALEEDAVQGDGEAYRASVLQARQQLVNFVNAKQTAFDACQKWLLHVQDGTSAAVGPSWFQLSEETLPMLDQLGSTAVKMQSILAELLQLAESQAAKGAISLGGRAKVYGIEDQEVQLFEPRLKRQASHSQAHGSTSAQTTSNGSSTVSAAPSAAPTAPVVPPLIDSRSASTPSAGLKAMFQRNRSTSVATGASGDSATRIASGQEDADSTRGPFRRRDTADGSISGAASAAASTVGEFGERPGEEVPWFLQPDSPPSDIILNPNGQVKGATLLALMERLTMHLAFDSSFNNTFLMTYRSFTTTDELLDLLFSRFRVQEPDGLSLEQHEQWVEKKQRPIRFRVFNVLKAWLESHHHEHENEVHMQRIKSFALDEMVHSPAMATPAQLLLRIIERRSGTGEQMKITMVMPALAPPPVLPKNFRKIKFLDIDPLEMARQLTLMDSRLYNRIRPAECLGKAWSRDNGAEIAKGVRDVISANNRVSGWVSEAILVQEDVKKRAAWVKQFVAIADRCFQLNNFSSMMAIYSGLNNASLNRLRRTWDAVNQRHLQMFENMRTILAPTRNFSKYRETLRKLNPPCVPFLGVYLTDLTFIEDGNTDRLRNDERLINFSKRQMTAEKIQEIMIYQSTPYNLTPVPGIQKFIEENLIEARSDDELFEQSLRLEPREREDEKIARLLQESGFL